MQARRTLDSRATFSFVWIVLVSTSQNYIQRLKLVGARGFEPPTSSSRTTRATKLRYAPTDPGAAGRLGYRSDPRHVVQYERAGDWLGASLSLPPHTMRTAVEAPRTTVTLNEALFALMVCTSSQTPATRR